MQGVLELPHLAHIDSTTFWFGVSRIKGHRVTAKFGLKPEVKGQNKFTEA